VDPRQAPVVDHTAGEVQEIAPKEVRPARYVTFRMAGVAAPRELFAAISPLNTKGVAVNRVRLA